MTDNNEEGIFPFARKNLGIDFETRRSVSSSSIYVEEIKVEENEWVEEQESLPQNAEIMCQTAFESDSSIEDSYDEEVAVDTKEAWGDSFNLDPTPPVTQLDLSEQALSQKIAHDALKQLIVAENSSRKLDSVDDTPCFASSKNSSHAENTFGVQSSFELNSNINRDSLRTARVSNGEKHSRKEFEAKIKMRAFKIDSGSCTFTLPYEQNGSRYSTSEVCNSPSLDLLEIQRPEEVKA